MSASPHRLFFVGLIRDHRPAMHEQGEEKQTESAPGPSPPSRPKRGCKSAFARREDGSVAGISILGSPAFEYSESSLKDDREDRPVKRSASTPTPQSYVGQSSSIIGIGQTLPATLPLPVAAPFLQQRRPAVGRGMPAPGLAPPPAHQQPRANVMQYPPSTASYRENKGWTLVEEKVFLVDRQRPSAPATEAAGKGPALSVIEFRRSQQQGTVLQPQTAWTPHQQHQQHPQPAVHASQPNATAQPQQCQHPSFNAVGTTQPGYMNPCSQQPQQHTQLTTMTMTYQLCQQPSHPFHVIESDPSSAAELDNAAVDNAEEVDDEELEFIVGDLPLVGTSLLQLPTGTHRAIGSCLRTRDCLVMSETSKALCPTYSASITDACLQRRDDGMVPPRPERTKSNVMCLLLRLSGVQRMLVKDLSCFFGLYEVLRTGGLPSLRNLTISDPSATPPAWFRPPPFDEPNVPWPFTRLSIETDKLQPYEVHALLEIPRIGNCVAEVSVSRNAPVLELFGWLATSRAPNLLSLTLGGNSSYYPVKPVIDALAQGAAPRLRTFNMGRGLALNGDAALGLASAIAIKESWADLKELRLCDVVLGSDSLTTLLNGICDSRHKLKNLRVLKLRNCWHLMASATVELGKALERGAFSGLEALDIGGWYTNLGVSCFMRESMTALIAALSNSPCSSTLMTLRLANCNLDGHCVQALSLAFCRALPNIECLDLSDNGFGDEGIMAIVSAMQARGGAFLSRLFSLFLFNCQFTAHGGAQLGMLLASYHIWPQLHVIGLDGTDRYRGQAEMSIVQALALSGRGHVIVQTRAPDWEQAW